MRINSLVATAGVAAVAAVLTFAAPARAADPVFPTGSRIGIVPPVGMVPSRSFEGFENPDTQAAILFTALPPAAYDQLDKSMVPEAMKKQGIEVDTREPVQLATGKGFILSGRQTTNKSHFRKWLLVAAAKDLTVLLSVEIPEPDNLYSDKAIRDALTTFTLRDTVPDAERLSLLPFKIGNLAGFQIDNVMPGRAIMLVDAAPDRGSDEQGTPLNARLLIAALPGAPEAKDRDNFARVAFDQVAGIKDIHIQVAEPLRINNQPGYETLAKAKDAQGDTDVMAVQWLRFGASGFLQMIGIARADTWSDAFTRMRAVRDSIEAK